MAGSRKNKQSTTPVKILWIVVAIIGSAWLVYSGLKEYISYWLDYSFSNSFFDYLVNPSAFALVKFVAGCTFFSIMIRDLSSLSKGLSITGMIASCVTAVFFVIGLFDGIKAVFFSDTVGKFFERLSDASLVTYLAYSILLIGMILFFAAGIRHSRSGKTKKILLIVGAAAVYAVSVLKGAFDQSTVTASMFFSETFADCLAYIAIAISVF